MPLVPTLNMWTTNKNFELWPYLDVQRRFKVTQWYHPKLLSSLQNTVEFGLEDAMMLWEKEVFHKLT